MIVLERKTSKGTWVQVSEVYAWPDYETGSAATSLNREFKESPDDEFRLAIYEFSRVVPGPHETDKA